MHVFTLFSIVWLELVGRQLNNDLNIVTRDKMYVSVNILYVLYPTGNWLNDRSEFTFSSTLWKISYPLQISLTHDYWLSDVRVPCGCIDVSSFESLFLSSRNWGEKNIQKSVDGVGKRKKQRQWFWGSASTQPPPLSKKKKYIYFVALYFKHRIVTCEPNAGNSLGMF